MTPTWPKGDGGFLRTEGGALVVSSAEIDGAFETYKVVRDRGAGLAGAVSGTRVFYPDSAVASNSNAAGRSVFYWDPALFAVTDRDTVCRVQALVVTNDTAPAATLTFGLHPVSASSGASGNVAITVGAAVSGSTAVATTPAANSQVAVASADFAAPAAGVYVLAVAYSGATAAGSDHIARVSLLTRQVIA